ncbi:MAG: metallopeptidase family protein [Dehalococcoidia bacterium]
MHRARFRRLVAAALDSIPEALASRIENVEVVVRSRPTAGELDAAGVPAGNLLLGLYQGHPLTARGSYYGNTLPDRIFIYQEAIEAICHGEDAVVRQVRATVLHEVAHHFGIDDERLHELGLS